MYRGVADFMLDFLGKFVSFYKVSEVNQLVELVNNLFLHFWLQLLEFSVKLLQDRFSVASR